MKTLRVLCFVFALMLTASAALADDLQTIVSALPDDALLYVLTITAAEALHRDLLPKHTIAAPSSTEADQDHAVHLDSDTAEPFPIDLTSLLENAASLYPHSETIISYDPPKSAPAYAPGQQLNPTDTVWVSKTGKKYHLSPDCSGMKNPIPIPYSNALHNHSACSNCAWWLK